MHQRYRLISALFRKKSISERRSSWTVTIPYRKARHATQRNKNRCFILLYCLCLLTYRLSLLYWFFYWVSVMGTKMAVAFANIFMAQIEEELKLNQTKPKRKARECKCYIDDFSLYGPPSERKFPCSLNKLATFIPDSIKFTTEISEIDVTFLEAIIYKGDRFKNDSILDLRTYYKPTEAFHYTHFTSSTHWA